MDHKPKLKVKLVFWGWTEIIWACDVNLTLKRKKKKKKAGTRV